MRAWMCQVCAQILCVCMDMSGLCMDMSGVHVDTSVCTWTCPLCAWTRLLWLPTAPHFQNFPLNAAGTFNPQTLGRARSPHTNPLWDPPWCLHCPLRKATRPSVLRLPPCPLPWQQVPEAPAGGLTNWDLSGTGRSLFGLFTRQIMPSGENGATAGLWW